MGLPVPEPGVTPAPTWGTNQQKAMQLLDAHRHVPGEGERVPTAGLNINDPLNMQGYPTYNQDSVQLVQRAVLPDWRPPQSSNRRSLYSKGVDLYFLDGSGREVKITQNGAVNGTGGGGGGVTNAFIVNSMADLMALSGSSLLANALYQTLGYVDPYDGGSASYVWKPAETSTHDGTFCIRPSGIGVLDPGRFFLYSPDGRWNMKASTLDWTGQTDNQTLWWQLHQIANSYGYKTAYINVPGSCYIGNAPAFAVQGYTIQGLPGHTKLISKITYESLLPSVRLIASSALPTCTAAGTGATKTLTRVGNGTLTVDTKLVALNDRILVAGQANPVDNGIYKCTQAGSGAAPWILTRAVDFNSSACLRPRLGVRSTDGSTASGGCDRVVYVLSNKDGFFYEEGASMTIDVDPQYWTREGYLDGGFSLAPTCQVPIFRQSVPSYPLQHCTSYLKMGDTVLPACSGVNGGAWVDPDSGINYNLLPLRPGTKIFLKIGGDPTDQGWYFRGLKTEITGFDPSTNNLTIKDPIPVTPPVITSKTGTVGAYGVGYTNLGTVAAVGTNQVTLTTIANAGLVSAGDSVQFVLPPLTPGTPRYGWGVASAPGNPATGNITFVAGSMPAVRVGDYAFDAICWPPYNLNQARHESENDIHVITDDCTDVTIKDIIFDGVGLGFSFVTNLRMENCEVRNVHVGSLFSGLVSPRFKDIKFTNVSGFHFNTSTGINDPNNWYGWAVQNNFCSDSIIDGIFINGLRGNVCDQEANNETTWKDVNIVFGSTDIAYQSCIVAATTSNVVTRNPVIGMTVSGAYQPTTAIISETVHNLTWNVQNSLGEMGVSSIPNIISGRLNYKGRGYAMDKRIHWRMRIPLGPTINKTYVRPYDGLWSNSRIWVSDRTGITGFFIGPFDLVSFIQNTPNQVWSDKFITALDTMLIGYPNAFTDEHQSMQVVTDGTSPAGAYLLIESDTIPQIDRGDNLQGVPTTTSALRAQFRQEASLQWEVVGAGSPVGAVTPLFVGQRYFDRVAAQYWESTNNTNADWVRMTV